MSRTRRLSLRWRIALLIGAAIAISYFDRQTLPVAIAAIQRDIPVTNTQFSWLQSAFLIAYGLMYAGGGKLLDVLGTKRGMTVIMIWWSLACASHGLAAGFGMLAASRFLLGMGEGGGFPAATKGVAEWFPVSERSTAMGIINAGTAVGAVIAPPAIASSSARPRGAGSSSSPAQSGSSGWCGGAARISLRTGIPAWARPSVRRSGRS